MHSTKKQRYTEDIKLSFGRLCNMQLYQKLPKREGIQNPSPLVTSGHNYGRGFHLFISEITFVWINSPTDSRISVEYFFKLSRNRIVHTFPQKNICSPIKSFQNTSACFGNATFSYEEFLVL